MKRIMIALCIVIAATVFVAIRFRQPMGFVLAAAAGAVAIYPYLTDNKEKN